MIINPVDKNAIEAALQLKEQFGGKVVLVSMAPPDAGEILKEALAMGVDEAYLLSDRAFAGSDTLATAKILAAGLKKIGQLDLILTGSESADSGTNHVPSQLGELLGLPHLNHITELSLELPVLKMKAKLKTVMLNMRAVFQWSWALPGNQYTPLHYPDGCCHGSKKALHHLGPERPGARTGRDRFVRVSHPTRGPAFPPAWT